MSTDINIISAFATIEPNPDGSIDYTIETDNGVHYEWFNLPDGMFVVNGQPSRVKANAGSIDIGDYEVVCRVSNAFNSTEIDFYFTIAPPSALDTMVTESQGTISMSFNTLDGEVPTVDMGDGTTYTCLLYTSPSPRDRQKSRMPSSA